MRHRTRGGFGRLGLVGAALLTVAVAQAGDPPSDGGGERNAVPGRRRVEWVYGDRASADRHRAANDRQQGQPQSLVFDDIPLEKLLELSIAGNLPIEPPAGWIGPSYFPHGYYSGPSAFADSPAYVLQYASELRAWNDELRKSAARLYNYRDMQQREDKLVAQSAKALKAGVEKLRAGEYNQAIAPLTMSAKMNQGDPASRIHLAQARLARGDYVLAGKLLRRALELQPNLIYADLHLDQYYPQIGTLQKIASAMDEKVRAAERADAEDAAVIAQIRDVDDDDNRDHHGKHEREAKAGDQRVASNARGDSVGPEGLDANFWFARGYVAYQLGDFDNAFAAYQHVLAVRPNDSAAKTYADLTRPVEAVAKSAR